MKIAHLAFNVAAPVAMAAWYGEHLGLTIALQLCKRPTALVRKA